MSPVADIPWQCGCGWTYRRGSRCRNPHCLTMTKENAERGLRLEQHAERAALDAENQRRLDASRSANVRRPAI